MLIVVYNPNHIVPEELDRLLEKLKKIDPETSIIQHFDDYYTPIYILNTNLPGIHYKTR